ncbi:putative ABC transporter ATP-binding protein YlmA [Cohnella xylanilytica]|uniref:ATP-binding cassette domain-containing protein n=1 Tax=Cohnella xylanilytica TaxID=557555 RepID=A0A841TVT8_9BACL|nr:ATP-binding cassette domain-containing protein [Cohnella xylanilytica]MBB6691138.1 ATP-binding cassette domain-containing protein [Cohnella xylanilytica]GIO11506.1 putative ABC transporter ATP-binding protein YlmA [Cohnella xylanilytica]
MIKLDHLTLRRGQRDILRGVDLEVKEGEHWVLLGRNGCGKTTVLEMINGYLFPTTGKVSVLGHLYGTVDLREVRKEIGYIGPSLIEKFTLRDPVWEIVVGGAYAYLRVYEEVPEEVRERAQAELERVGFGHMAEQSFGTLSQGERKKVLLARTMMADPKLLILDEPCAGLDLYEREKFLDAMSGLARRNMSMLYVTHHIEEIIPMFTHVALMADGRIVAAGPKREVLTPELLRSAYDVPVTVEWHEDRPWIRVGKEN